MTKIMLIAMVALTAGCYATAPAMPQAAGPMMRVPDQAMYGWGRAPIPGRPPVPVYSGSIGVQAPFSNSVFKITVRNDVKFRGETPLIITRLWVGGVEKPLAKRAMMKSKMFDHVFTVNYLDHGVSVEIGLPPVQFMDGSGQGKVRIIAQSASWRLDPLGHKIADGNVRCIQDWGYYGDTVVLDWNHTMKTIACPEQTMASR